MIVRNALMEDKRAVKNLLETYGLESDFNPKECLVAVEDKRIVGCVRLKDFGSFYELAGLAVEAESQGQGIGEALVKKALEGAGNKPVYCLTVEPGFFMKYGFKKIEGVDLPKKLGEKVGFCMATGAEWTGMVRNP
ncbi:MAG: GNAT family N-acetyltransferase [Methanobacteriota archaeon]|nr:MAG: GNAT family N-acetyltransferase [Euryarchaeota archaeon]